MASMQGRSTEETLISLVPKLQLTASRIINRSDVADDAVQEALIKASEMTAEPENLEGWFYRAVVHRSLTARRASLRRSRNERSASEAHVPGYWASSTPANELEAKELQEHILSALDKLPREQRDAFVLHEVEGMEYQEIASVQQVPIGTVRSRLNRARMSLRQHLTIYRSRCPACNPARRSSPAPIDY